MSRKVLAAVVLASMSCATQKEAEKKADPIMKQVRVTNLTYFDLANCSNQSLELPQPVNREILVGALISQRVHVFECLVDPKTRGPAAETTIAVDSTVTDAGATHKVSGTNLTADGQKCIEGVLAKLKIAPLPKGAAPVTEKAEFKHNPSSPMVTIGINELSDVVAKIRLAQPNWCDCYAEWGTKSPRALQAKLKLNKAKPETNEIEVTATGDAASDKVGACLKGKLAAETFAFESEQIEINYPFNFINSASTEELVDGNPDMQFKQFDAQRSQRMAQTALQIGQRLNAAATYNNVVTKFKAKPNSVSVKELKDKCAALVKTDDAWIAALKSQLELDQRTLKLASGQKTKDAEWAEVESKSQKVVATTTADISSAEQTKVKDQASCPKVTY